MNRKFLFIPIFGHLYLYKYGIRRIKEQPNNMEKSGFAFCFFNILLVVLLLAVVLDQAVFYALNKDVHIVLSAITAYSLSIASIFVSELTLNRLIHVHNDGLKGEYKMNYEEFKERYIKNHEEFYFKYKNTDIDIVYDVSEDKKELFCVILTRLSKRQEFVFSSPEEMLRNFKVDEKTLEEIWDALT